MTKETYEYRDEIAVRGRALAKCAVTPEKSIQLISAGLVVRHGQVRGYVRRAEEFQDHAGEGLLQNKKPDDCHVE